MVFKGYNTEMPPSTEYFCSKYLNSTGLLFSSMATHDNNPKEQTKRLSTSPEALGNECKKQDISAPLGDKTSDEPQSREYTKIVDNDMYTFDLILKDIHSQLYVVLE